ncbi:2-phospho-L-lactate transferase [Nesterenkonia sp. NBAIMH1]|uniref:2-phospho-L-lactate transferase n=1 Tax=Nesterenkonia sp. NBAIMH1 TaxID=2600320 RepID=UPI0011B6A0A3|nr:2-phospho-L-lactate transferase [Nesterenkonia sp. NBAIMH1]
MLRVAVIAGGVGGAKFVRGLRSALTPEDRVDVVVNTGDDMWLTGVRVCPDLDSMMYALAGVNDAVRGWGRQHESERVSAELTAYGVGWPWFTLGDLDLGTHLARTAMLREGRTLSDVTDRLCSRWADAFREPQTRLLPASDDEVETWVRTEDAGEATEMHFEEWWVRTRASAPAQRFIQRGAEEAVAAPGAAEALGAADVILLAPSNPVVSVGTVLGLSGEGGQAGLPGIPGAGEALRTAAAPVVGVSPIIGEAPIHGMARECLEVLGHDCSAAAVARAYGARRAGGLLDGWLVDEQDESCLAELEATGIRAESVPLRMRDEHTSRRLAQDALSLATALSS